MKKRIFLAGGCFWGTEKYLSLIKGVTKTEVGYANGKTENPTYEEVCSHKTGHAETVMVEYDESVIRLEELLALFFDVINPVSVNRQGADVGIQYRTGIFYTDDSDKWIIDESIDYLQRKYDEDIAIEVKTLENFYPAEEYHQKYLEKNPAGYCHIGPSLFQKAAAFTPAKNYSKENSQSQRFDSIKNLTPLQYDVTQNAATEAPFTGKYDSFFEEGIYVDIVSGEVLFSSKDKYNSGCGWPAFSRPVRKEQIVEIDDNSLGRKRTEVRSAEGNSHLGHVFNDGPAEKGGMRYCINSAALRFIPVNKLEDEGYGEYRKLFG